MILFFLISSGIGGCSLVDEGLSTKSNEGTISCLMNGEPFEVEGGKGLLASEFVKAEMEKSEDYFLLTVYGIRVLEEEGEKRGLAVGFKLGGERLMDISQGDTFSKWEALDEIEGTFEGAMGGVEERKSESADEHLLKASSNHTGKMSMTVTAIDTLDQLISGTFHFTAKDQESGEVIEVTEGAFENIKWVNK